MGRGRSVTGNKMGRPPKNVESVINAPSLSALGDLDKLEIGESFKREIWIGERELPTEQQNFSATIMESMYAYENKRIDYNQFYTMNAPVGETEKAFKIGVTVKKRGKKSVSTKSKLKDEDYAQTAFVPKSATRLVTKSGRKYFQVKGWVLDKIRQEKIEYWHNRLNRYKLYYNVELDFNND